MRPKLGQEGSEAFFEIVKESMSLKVLDQVLSHFIRRMGEDVLRTSSGLGEEGQVREIAYKKARYDGAVDLLKFFREEAETRRKGTADEKSG